MEPGMCKRKPIAAPLPVPSGKRCKCDDECTSTCSNAIVCFDSSIFERSSLPTRFMFYERGDWKDFLQETSSALGTSFQARHNSVKFSQFGSRYLLSFIRMLQVNLDTGFCRSIAWIDVLGKRFVPPRCVEGYGIRLLQPEGKARPCSRGPSLHESDDDAVNGGGLCAHESTSNSRGTTSRNATPPHSLLGVGSRECSMTDTITHCAPLPNSNDHNDDDDDYDDEVSSDSLDTSSTIVSSDSSTSGVTSSLHTTAASSGGLQKSQNFPLLHDKLLCLKPADSEFEEVKKRFLAGLSVLANHSMVTGISKICHRTTSGQVRHQAFKQQEALLKILRGDANIRHAWYGTSRHGVSSVVLHGFGQPKTPKDGGMYGVGVYLVPEKYSNVSAVYSDVDENGEQHVVFCRVIMGNMEQVARGSTQFHPGSEDYDGGVDNLCNPRQYIVWSTSMNTSILPEYVVSFKLAAPWKGVITALRNRRKLGQSVHETSQHGEHGKVQFDKVIPGFCSNPSRSPWMSIDMLFLLLKSSLPAERMNELQQHHLSLKEGRLSSPDFINRVRSIAGDNLVSSSLKSMQTHVLGAVLLQNLLSSQRCSMVDNRKLA